MLLELPDFILQLISFINGGVLNLSASDNLVLGIDMSIESLRSRNFSVYIFIFLIFSLILFCYIIYLYLPKKLNDLKLGEKIMFGSIVLGVIIAIIIGYIQLIEGYLM